jgi:hypothetical protein
LQEVFSAGSKASSELAHGTCASTRYFAAPHRIVTAGAIALKLTCPADPGDGTIVRGAAAISQGRGTCSSCRMLGACPAPTQGVSVITSLYLARVGEPRVGKKTFVQANLLVDGWESLPTTFWAIVSEAS